MYVHANCIVVAFEIVNTSDIRVLEGGYAEICLVAVGDVSAYYNRSDSYIRIYVNVSSDTASKSRVYVCVCVHMRMHVHACVYG